jgi:hypothetical protein
VPYKLTQALLGGGLMLALVSCGGDDDGGGRASSSRRPTSETTASDGTEPPSSDLTAVQPRIEDLLGQWDEAMTIALEDPQAVVDDPDHAAHEALAAIFTEDSPYVADFDQFLTDGYVAQDVGVRPGPSGLSQQTTFLEFSGTPGSDDEVSFVFCSFNDGEGFTLSDGSDRPPSVGIVQGAGDASRVDGAWRLHRLQQLGFDSQPAGTPNPCPGLVATDGGQG